MVDEDTENLLREFLGREKKAEQYGYTREAVLKAMDTVAKGLQEHERKCDKRWENNETRLQSAEKRLQNLEASHAARPEPSPVQAQVQAAGDDAAEITSSHRIDAIAAKVKRATLESLRVPGADPESYVRKVVVEEREAFDKRAEFKRLKQKETDEALGRETEAKERRERNRLLFVGIASVVGGAAILGLVQLITSHFH
jgi:hypothetical protein